MSQTFFFFNSGEFQALIVCYSVLGSQRKLGYLYKTILAIFSTCQAKGNLFEESKLQKKLAYENNYLKFQKRTERHNRLPNILF